MAQPRLAVCVTNPLSFLSLGWFTSNLLSRRFAVIPVVGQDYMVSALNTNQYSGYVVYITPADVTTLKDFWKALKDYRSMRVHKPIFLIGKIPNQYIPSDQNYIWVWRLTDFMKQPTVYASILSSLVNK